MVLMIVDDNDDMRAVIRAAIADLASSIIECRDGLEAVTRYADCRPAWVLMDVAMPVLDGVSATRRLVSADPGARVAILTQFDDDYLREAAHAAGAVAYLLKDDVRAVRALLGSTAGPARRE